MPNPSFFWVGIRLWRSPRRPAVIPSHISAQAQTSLLMSQTLQCLVSIDLFNKLPQAPPHSCPRNHRSTPCSWAQQAHSWMTLSLCPWQSVGQEFSAISFPPVQLPVVPRGPVKARGRQGSLHLCFTLFSRSPWSMCRKITSLSSVGDVPKKVTSSLKGKIWAPFVTFLFPPVPSVVLETN